MAQRRPRTTAASTAPRARQPRRRATPRRDQVSIRMYGQGVGDCFLLTFPRANARGARPRPVYVVIDCGVIGGTPDGAARMQAVVRDIKETTLDTNLKDADGAPLGHIDLLVVTHEHWDHVSGFVQAEPLWRQIKVDALWLAWTEQEDQDGLPDALRKVLERQRRAVAEVADRARRFGLGDRQATVLDLAAFLSDAPAQGLAFGAAPGVSDAFRIARSLAPNGMPVYCEPGDVRRVPGTDAVAYVLGPPRADRFLTRLRPTRAGSETYHQPEAARGLSLQALAEGRSAFSAFVAPLVDAAPLPAAEVAASAASAEPVSAAADSSERATAPKIASDDSFEQSFPFRRSLRVALPIAEAAQQEVDAAGQLQYPALASYFDPLGHWRRIDFDWLGVAEAFALRADSLTNNTSLVLAFELPAITTERPKVLLFAADAQVGNWLSWDEIPAWTAPDGAQPGQERPDIGELLHRTAFYKVGHHGSHNATLKANGLERMPDDGTLTAFVPVSAPVARGIKDWCHMPLDTLLDALNKRTHDRVVFPNGNVWPQVEPAKVDAARERLGLTVAPKRLPAIVSRDGEDLEGEVPLWVEIALPY